MDQNDAKTDRVGKFPKTLAGAEVSDIHLTEEEIYVGGERLTEERAEQMAAEFTASFLLRNHVQDM